MQVPDGLILPLRVGKNDYDYDQLYDHADCWVCGTNHNYATREIADYIALAVNNHGKLVGVAEDACRRLSGYDPTETDKLRERLASLTLTPTPEPRMNAELAAKLRKYACDHACSEFDRDMKLAADRLEKSA